MDKPSLTRSIMDSIYKCSLHSNQDSGNQEARSRLKKAFEISIVMVMILVAVSLFSIPLIVRYFGMLEVMFTI